MVTFAERKGAWKKTQEHGEGGGVWRRHTHAVGHTDPGGGYRGTWAMGGPGSQEPPEGQMRRVP